MKTLAANALLLAEFVRPTDRILLGHGTGEPITLLETLLAQREALSGARLFMHTSFSGLVRPEHADHLVLEGLGAVGTQRDLYAAGVLDIYPSHLSDFDQLLRSGGFQIDVVFIQVSSPDAAGRFSLGLLNDFQVQAMRRARVVIAEQNDQYPFTYSDPLLTEADIDILVPTSRALIEIPAGKIGDTERLIAANAIRFVGDGATLQLGVGAIPDAIVAGLIGHRNLGIHSGVIPDAFVDLMEAGAITNSTKHIDQGRSVTGAIWGTKRLYDAVAHNPAISLRSLSHTHCPGTFALLPDFVSMNSAIEVDLSGQANLELADGRYIGAIGGSVDFVRGARMAPRGRSIIALPSTAGRGKFSRIVLGLGGAATVARSDIDTVVTEFGCAELRGHGLQERARRLIAIAHPDFREQLERSTRTTGSHHQHDDQHNA